jgi:nucleotide-binding universal stress UspA family protein
MSEDIGDRPIVVGTGSGPAMTGLAVEVAVLMRPVVPTLVGESRNAQSMALGSAGLDGFTGMVLGSTSQALVCHVTWPRLVARPTRNP